MYNILRVASVLAVSAFLLAGCATGSSAKSVNPNLLANSITVENDGFGRGMALGSGPIFEVDQEAAGPEIWVGKVVFCSEY